MQGIYLIQEQIKHFLLAQYLHYLQFLISQDPVLSLLLKNKICSKQGTFESWISGLMRDPHFFLISILNNAACFPLTINLQIN